jgi:hypothetical protein
LCKRRLRLRPVPGPAAEAAWRADHSSPRSGHGDFGTPVEFPVPDALERNWLTEVRVSDFDADENLDLVAAHCATG